MLQEQPDDTFLLYALAMEHRGGGDDNAALQELQRVLEMDKHYVAAYFQKGQILAARGDAEPAIDVLQRGILVAQQVGDDHARREMMDFLQSL